MSELEELKRENATLRKLLSEANRAGQAVKASMQKQEPSAQLALPDVVRYPLAEFAEGRGRNIPLPETIEEIAQVIGRGNALRLVEGTHATGSRSWRRQIYVPAKLNGTHRLARLIGVEAATLLSRSHRNCILELPSCFALRKAYMACHALGMIDCGASIGEVAVELGVDPKTAMCIWDNREYWRAHFS